MTIEYCVNHSIKGIEYRKECTFMSHEGKPNMIEFNEGTQYPDPALEAMGASPYISEWTRLKRVQEEAELLLKQEVVNFTKFQPLQVEILLSKFPKT